MNEEWNSCDIWKKCQFLTLVIILLQEYVWQAVRTEFRIFLNLTKTFYFVTFNFFFLRTRCIVDKDVTEEILLVLSTWLEEVCAGIQ